MGQTVKHTQCATLPRPLARARYTAAMTSSPTTRTILRDYLRAKDENRALFLRRGFAPDAFLSMVLNTGEIDFPAESMGVDAVAQTLAVRFNQTYENIFTFYLGEPDENARYDAYHCSWLVGMTEKATGNVRVGCGTYDWLFDDTPYRAKALRITIEHMRSLPPADADGVFDWLLAAPYPFTQPAVLAAGMPALPALDPIRAYLAAPLRAAGS